MMLGELKPCGGGDTIPLTQPRLLIGRRSRCDITLPFKNVSSHHCELNLEDGYWHIRDLGSSNGIKVNGLRVDAQCLMPDDEVMIAKFAFRINYTVDPAAAPPEAEDPFARSLMEKAGLEQAPKTSRATAGANASASKSVRRNCAKDDFLMDWLSEE